MKKSLVLATLFSVLALAACGDKEESKVSKDSNNTSSQNDTSSSRDLPKECEAYFKEVDRLLVNLSGPIRESVKSQSESLRSTFMADKNLSKNDLAQICLQASDSLKPIRNLKQ
ncbi:hypothetical protein [Taylorella asinigenitalis]|uniref:Lipoprotein n=1 Tax=Taylorella asinigenitalis (strain MCE3) TaxID=1008459 RepID=G4Q9I8_TAYAM|nr:hypothetical protein [Taylorella asinigenitalis]AEP36525.1 hypothetical protein TASI_0754 [Taylorella asinigenitalis MCE3]